jgi:hypothetical protein
MKGSDIDLMLDASNIHVYEDINKVRLNSRETSCVMDHSISSFLDPLHPIGTKSIPWSIILDFNSLLGQEVLGLVTHL